MDDFFGTLAAQDSRNEAAFLSFDFLYVGGAVGDLSTAYHLAPGIHDLHEITCGEGAFYRHDARGQKAHLARK